MAVRRRRVVGGRQNKAVVRFTDEEFEVVSAAAARAGVSVPNLIATSVLGVAAAEGLAGLDRRAVVEEMAAVRRFLDVCVAGLTGGDGVRVVGMVEEAVAPVGGGLG